MSMCWRYEEASVVHELSKKRSVVNEVSEVKGEAGEIPDCRGPSRPLGGLRLLF